MSEVPNCPDCGFAASSDFALAVHDCVPDAMTPDEATRPRNARDHDCRCVQRPACAPHGWSEHGGGEPDICQPHSHDGIVLRTEAGRRLWRFLEKRYEEAGLITAEHIADVEREAATTDHPDVRAGLAQMPTDRPWAIHRFRDGRFLVALYDPGYENAVDADLDSAIAAALSATSEPT
jgi:hypothetical protein